MARSYSSSSDTGTAVAGLFIILFALAGVVGWVWNIAKIVGTVADPITALFALRCVGIFVAPLGAVLGFF